MNVHIIPALKDNYVYALQPRGADAVWAVDPGEARPVADFLLRNEFALAGILCTHHHADHVGGVLELSREWDCPVVTSEYDFSRIPGATKAVRDGEVFVAADVEWTAIAIPGHTLGHTAFYSDGLGSSGLGVLFCGDTLFSMGCGRLFEGTAEQLYHSLKRLASLPADTRCYCGHEYTLQNARFALEVDPANEALRRRFEVVRGVRDEGLATMPTLLSDELQTNPFLRAGSVEEFTQLRLRKDVWRG